MYRRKNVIRLFWNRFSLPTITQSEVRILFDISMNSNPLETTFPPFRSLCSSTTYVKSTTKKNRKLSHTKTPEWSEKKTSQPAATYANCSCVPQGGRAERERGASVFRRERIYSIAKGKEKKSKMKKNRRCHKRGLNGLRF